MSSFASQDGLMGVFAFGIVPWIGWTLLRGLRDERLPIGRTYVRREERPGAYYALSGFWLTMALMAVMIGLDLLFRIDVRFWL